MGNFNFDNLVKHLNLETLKSKNITLPLFLVTISNSGKLAILNNSFDNKHLVKYNSISSFTLIDMNIYNVSFNMLGRFYNIEKIDNDLNLITLNL